MTVGQICSRDVATVRRGEPLSDAAALMLRHHVGSVIVVDDHGGGVFPVGVVTDRDALRTQLSRDADLNCMSVAEAVSADPLAVNADDARGHLARQRVAVARLIGRKPRVERD